VSLFSFVGHVVGGVVSAVVPGGSAIVSGVNAVAGVAGIGGTSTSTTAPRPSIAPAPAVLPPAQLEQLQGAVKAAQDAAAAASAAAQKLSAPPPGLIPGVPNWVLLAGAGGLALFLVLRK
jgi:hypothetical protein